MADCCTCGCVMGNFVGLCVGSFMATVCCTGDTEHIIGRIAYLERLLAASFSQRAEVREQRQFIREAYRAELRQLNRLQRLGRVARHNEGIVTGIALGHPLREPVGHGIAQTHLFPNTPRAIDWREGQGAQGTPSFAYYWTAPGLAIDDPSGLNQGVRVDGPSGAPNRPLIAPVAATPASLESDQIPERALQTSHEGVVALQPMASAQTSSTRIAPVAATPAVPSSLVPGTVRLHRGAPSLPSGRGRQSIPLAERGGATVRSPRRNRSQEHLDLNIRVNRSAARYLPRSRSSSAIAPAYPAA